MVGGSETVQLIFQVVGIHQILRTKKPARWSHFFRLPCLTNLAFKLEQECSEIKICCSDRSSGRTLSSAGRGASRLQQEQARGKGNDETPAAAFLNCSHRVRVSVLHKRPKLLPNVDRFVDAVSWRWRTLEKSRGGMGLHGSGKHVQV